MAAIIFHNVSWEKPQAPALSDMNINVIFEVLDAGLADDMDLRLTYIHAEESTGQGTLANVLGEDAVRISDNDEILDEMACGPLDKVGKRKVQLQGEHPNFEKMSEVAKLDIAAVVVSASYQNMEFFRIGWYVRHEYEDENLNTDENRPSKADMSKCVRRVNIENPIETKVEVPWGKILDNDKRTLQERQEEANLNAKRRKLGDAGESAMGGHIIKDLTAHGGGPITQSSTNPSSRGGGGPNQLAMRKHDEEEEPNPDEVGLVVE